MSPIRYRFGFLFSLGVLLWTLFCQAKPERQEKPFSYPKQARTCRMDRDCTVYVLPKCYGPLYCSPPCGEVHVTIPTALNQSLSGQYYMQRLDEERRRCGIAHPRFVCRECKGNQPPMPAAFRFRARCKKGQCVLEPPYDESYCDSDLDCAVSGNCFACGRCVNAKLLVERIAKHGDCKAQCQAKTRPRCKCVANRCVPLKPGKMKPLPKVSTKAEPPKLKRSKKRKCKREQDCALLPDPACTCLPCGVSWRKTLNQRAFRRWMKKWASRTCPELSCPACETSLLGTKALCVKGQCVVRK